MISLSPMDFHVAHPNESGVFATRTVHLGSVVTVIQEDDPTTTDLMHAVELGGALDFWNDPSENIYDESDGDAL